MRYYSLVSNSIFLMLLYLHKFSILQFDTLSDAYDKNVYFVKRYLSLKKQMTNSMICQFCTYEYNNVPNAISC